jgi:tryptophan-rich sensory protein
MITPNFFKLLISHVLPIGLGVIAGIFTTKEIAGWHASLNKPSFNLPSYLFGLVWSALYVIMGVSMLIIWNTPKTELR